MGKESLHLVTSWALGRRGSPGSGAGSCHWELAGQVTLLPWLAWAV